jgi:5-methylthioadenosine/S-adenosylhomocysteine deaminase
LEKAEILIYGCTILPMNDKNFIENGAIAIKNGKIVFVGKASLATSIKTEKWINAKGKVAMPGLINCHTHASMTLFRGIAEDKPLDAWLKETIWPLEAKLRAEDVYVGALLGCLEMIKGGITCFADMYFHEEKVAKAVKQSGMRAALAHGIIEAGNKELGRKMFNESIDFVKKFHGQANGRITALLGPHAAYSCSRDLLREVREKASELGVGVHIHLAESKTMLEDFSEVEFLDEIGFFKGHVLAAHCINLSKNDMHTLSKRGVNVVHVPVANMKLGLGAAKIKDLISLGVNVCLGTDGPASNNTLDMFETMKLAALLQKLTYMDPTVSSAYAVLKMATLNGAKALGLADKIGSLEIGKRADLILIDFSKPHLKPLHDVFSSIVYSAHGSDVDTVIVDGKIIMENRCVKTLDETSVIREAEKAASDLLAR